MDDKEFDAEVAAIQKELEGATASYEAELESARTDLNKLLTEADKAMEDAAKELGAEDVDE